MVLSCEACGKKNLAARYPVLKSLPDGEYQELGVCASCRSKFIPVETLFVRVSGSPYTQKQRLPFWSNGIPLRWQEGQEFNPAPVLLSDYPLIEDFEVLLEG